MRPIVRCAALVFAGFVLAGCSGQVETRLDSGIGLSTYRNLGLIYQKPVGVGLYVEPQALGAVVNVKHANINYSIPVGETLAARLMHVLALQFERVQLLDKPQMESGGALDAVLSVSLKDVEASVRLNPRWNTVATESEGWIEVEAVLRDHGGRTVWIGTSRAETSASTESIMVAGSQDAGVAMSRAIETTVAKLVNQMAASTSLREFVSRARRG